MSCIVTADYKAPFDGVEDWEFFYEGQSHTSDPYRSVTSAALAYFAEHPTTPIGVTRELYRFRCGSAQAILSYEFNGAVYFDATEDRYYDTCPEFIRL